RAEPEEGRVLRLALEPERHDRDPRDAQLLETAEGLLGGVRAISAARAHRVRVGHALVLPVGEGAWRGRRHRAGREQEQEEEDGGQRQYTQTRSYRRTFTSLRPGTTARGCRRSGSIPPGPPSSLSSSATSARRASTRDSAVFSMRFLVRTLPAPVIVRLRPVTRPILERMAVPSAAHFSVFRPASSCSAVASSRRFRSSLSWIFAPAPPPPACRPAAKAALSSPARDVDFVTGSYQRLSASLSGRRSSRAFSMPRAPVAANQPGRSAWRTGLAGCGVRVDSSTATGSDSSTSRAEEPPRG